MRRTILNSMVLWLALLSLVVASGASAQRGEPGRVAEPRAVRAEPQAVRADPQAVRDLPRADAEVRRPGAVDGRTDAAVARDRRADCARRDVSRRAADCGAYANDYYDGDDDNAASDSNAEQSAPASEGAPPAAPATGNEHSATSASPSDSLTPAQLSAIRQSEQVVDDFTPELGTGLRSEMEVARNNWMAKKAVLDDVNGEWAKAEYQAYQSGGPIDPEVTLRQKQAQREADAAWAVMAPLVERARKEGLSESVIELYEDDGDWQ